MSDTVILLIALFILVAVIVTLLLRGRIRIGYGDSYVDAKRLHRPGGSMKVEATGKGSSATNIHQTADNLGDANLEVKARRGGELKDVEQRLGSNAPAEEEKTAPDEPK